MIHDAMHVSYNMYLVVLSYLIAVTASYTALDMSGRVTHSAKGNRKIWLGCGAVSMGIGIWGMHFVGMLAMQFPISVTYKVVQVILSILFAIGSSLLAIYIASRHEIRSYQLLAGSMVMGGAISGMHYIGMSAIEEVQVTYDPLLFCVSILIAVLASVVALMLAFRFRESHAKAELVRKLASGMVMGIAITGMHYAGMAAASYYPAKDGASGVSTLPHIDQSLLALLVAVSAFVILKMVLISSCFTDRRTASRQAFHRSILESTMHAFLLLDQKGTITGCNIAAERTTGYAQEQLVGHSLFELITAIPGDAKYADTAALEQAGLEAMTNRFYEVQLRLAPGGRLPAELSVVRLSGEDPPIYLACFSDISGKKRAEAKLEETRGLSEKFVEGLPLGYLLCRGDMIIKANHKALQLLEVSYPDIVLQKPLSRWITKSSQTPYKLWMDNMVKNKSAAVIRLTIHTCEWNLLQVTLEGQRILLDGEPAVHIFILDAGADSSVPEHLSGGGTAAERASAMGEGMLQAALDNGQFKLIFQPRIRLNDYTLTGVEVLLRWEHPEYGLLSPSFFLTQIVKAGLVPAVGFWIFEQAAVQLKMWSDLGWGPLHMSVNLWNEQLDDTSLSDKLQGLLAQSGLSVPSMAVEIQTDWDAVNPVMRVERLTELRQGGIAITLANLTKNVFSVECMKKVPVQAIEIGRDYIHNLSDKGGTIAVVRAIIAMAHSLGLQTVAKGVETQEQLAILSQLGCDEVQGYYLCAPLAADDLQKMRPELLAFLRELREKLAR
ncbi:EAL domain-containing protein [Paenibacillus thalictri]|uniref:EAL domain-containing protein n=1 Tax=Paenibacillus thalictri TaxID=2527873 RepID=A0A4Q9DXN8_9BACL|nr:EAL domain-containing protein [Paenibacillus thalictri]TBL80623.1 EAL domain-containing protein [Paenibacillus thalictri]